MCGCAFPAQEFASKFPVSGYAPRGRRSGPDLEAAGQERRIPVTDGGKTGVDMKKKQRTSNRKLTKAFKIILGILSCLSFVWFFIPVFRGICNVGNFLGMLGSAGVVAYLLIVSQLGKRGYRKAVRVLNPIVFTVLALVLAWVTVLTGCMIAGASSTPPENVTVVVLGCQVKGTMPSKHLQLRIEKAAEYLKAHPQANCIASGGKGDGEDLSEAQVIYSALVDRGIAPERIRKEDQSTSTVENLRNSLAVIRENGWPESLAVVTDEYHQFRAGMIAGQMGAKAYAVPAHSPWYSFSAYYARELLAITKDALVRS